MPGSKPRTREQMAQRIRDNVDYCAKTGCWNWKLSKNAAGYGLLKWSRPSGLEQRAHRISYIIFKGEIPEGMIVRHTCDNPSCVNPAHLVLGTHADNVQDKVDRNRQTKGEDVHFSKVSEAQVVEIRERYAAGGVSQKELAAEYGLEGGTLHHLLTGKNWAHVGGPIHQPREHREQGELDMEAARAIRKRYAQGGISQRKLGELYGVTQSQISLVVNYKVWKEEDYEDRGQPGEE